jgi:hypothetical protein
MFHRHVTVRAMQFDVYLASRSIALMAPMINKTWVGRYLLTPWGSDQWESLNSLDENIEIDAGNRLQAYCYGFGTVEKAFVTFELSYRYKPVAVVGDLASITDRTGMTAVTS